MNGEEMADAIAAAVMNCTTRNQLDEQTTLLVLEHVIANLTVIHKHLITIAGPNDEAVTDEKLLDGYENDEQGLTHEVATDDKEREDDTTDA